MTDALDNPDSFSNGATDPTSPDERSTTDTLEEHSTTGWGRRLRDRAFEHVVLTGRPKFYSGLLGEICTPLGGIGVSAQIAALLIDQPWYRGWVLGGAFFTLTIGAYLKQISR